MTVLVVDDDAAIRLLCRVNLELEGHRVGEAGTLDEARAALAAEPVDVVLLDLHVGSERGLDLLRELRRDRPDVAVALLTGSPHERISPDEAAADAVISKPFAIEQLGETVSRLAGSRTRWGNLPVPPDPLHWSASRTGRIRGRL
jgi:two-component system, OmpR family, KDP operon response regulator KdpE